MDRHFGDTTRIQSCVDRWLAGDESARNELLERSQRRLYQLAAKMLQGFPSVRRRVEKHDVVQEVNRRLLLALKDVQPNSVTDFMGLAARHIRWQLLDWTKKYRHEKAAPNGSHLPIDRPDSTSGPAGLAQWAEFHAAIEKLEPETRRLFDLLYYGDLTISEAAVELGISASTVRRQWRVARCTAHDAVPGQRYKNE